MEKAGRNFHPTALSSESQLTVWAAKPDVSYPTLLTWERKSHAKWEVSHLTYTLKCAYTFCLIVPAVVVWPPWQLKLELWQEQARDISRFISQCHAPSPGLPVALMFPQPSWSELAVRPLMAGFRGPFVLFLAKAAAKFTTLWTFLL